MVASTYHSTNRPIRAIPSHIFHERITRALHAAGYVVKPGVLAGRPLARLIVKAGAQW